MKNKVEDLRNHLFEVIEGLKDGSVDIEKAKAIADVGQVIVNSAKVEVDYLRVTGAAEGSGFIPDMPRGPAPLPAGDKPPRISKT
jgi:hypothetical protein